MPLNQNPRLVSSQQLSILAPLLFTDRTSMTMSSNSNHPEDLLHYAMTCHRVKEMLLRDLAAVYNAQPPFKTLLIPINVSIRAATVALIRIFDSEVLKIALQMENVIKGQESGITEFMSDDKCQEYKSSVDTLVDFTTWLCEASKELKEFYRPLCEISIGEREGLGREIEKLSKEVVTIVIGILKNKNLDKKH